MSQPSNWQPMPGSRDFEIIQIALHMTQDIEVPCRQCGKPHTIPRCYQGTRAFENCGRALCVQSRLKGEWPHDSTDEPRCRI